MKKYQLFTTVTMLLLLLCGCSNYAKDYDDNTLVVKKNGSLIEIAVEDFKDSTVKAEDLEAYIEEQISNYNEKNGKKSIKAKTLDTEDMSKVKLVLQYKDVDSYNGFNALDAKLAAFVDFDEKELTGTFSSPEKKSVKVKDMEGVDKAKVVVLSEPTKVVIPGNILYYNEEVQIKGEEISTKGNENAIIIFK